MFKVRYFKDTNPTFVKNRVYNVISVAHNQCKCSTSLYLLEGITDGYTTCSKCKVDYELPLFNSCIFRVMANVNTNIKIL